MCNTDIFLHIYYPTPGYSPWISSAKTATAVSHREAAEFSEVREQMFLISCQAPKAFYGSIQICISSIAVGTEVIPTKTFKCERGIESGHQPVSRVMFTVYWCLMFTTDGSWGSSNWHEYHPGFPSSIFIILAAAECFMDFCNGHLSGSERDRAG